MTIARRNGVRPRPEPPRRGGGGPAALHRRGDPRLAQGAQADAAATGRAVRPFGRLSQPAGTRHFDAFDQCAARHQPGLGRHDLLVLRRRPRAAGRARLHRAPRATGAGWIFPPAYRTSCSAPAWPARSNCSAAASRPAPPPAPGPTPTAGEEAGVVVRGRLELWVDGKRFDLQPGDSFGFPSTLPHRYSNPGPDEAEVIWAITPPTY